MVSRLMNSTRLFRRTAALFALLLIHALCFGQGYENSVSVSWSGFPTSQMLFLVGPKGDRSDGELNGRIHSAGLFSADYAFLINNRSEGEFSLSTISFWDDGSTVRTAFGSSFYYRYNYILKDVFRLYSGIGAGFLFLSKDNAVGFPIIPILQLVPIGFSYGNKTFLSFEAGAGGDYVGFRIGVGIRF